MGKERNSTSNENFRDQYAKILEKRGSTNKTGFMVVFETPKGLFCF